MGLIGAAASVGSGTASSARGGYAAGFTSSARISGASILRSTTLRVMDRYESGEVSRSEGDEGEEKDSY